MKNFYEGFHNIKPIKTFTQKDPVMTKYMGKGTYHKTSKSRNSRVKPIIRYTRGSILRLISTRFSSSFFCSIDTGYQWFLIIKIYKISNPMNIK